MKQKVLQVVSVVAAVLSIGCESTSSTNTLPASAEQALVSYSSLELLSLNPIETGAADGFHGWNIIGNTTVKDSESRAQLVSAFKSGVAENDGTVAACFNPRHGIKLVDDGNSTVHEFLICFECYQVRWFVDGQESNGFLITDSPQPTFDNLLSKSMVDADETHETTVE